MASTKTKTKTKKRTAKKPKAKPKPKATRNARAKKIKRRAPAKPGRAARVGREPRIDHVLVERTLNLLAEHDRAEGALERRVGAHLLDAYFGGDVELARSSSPAKAKSYGRLLDRAPEETTWTVDRMRRAVNAEAAARSLPAALADEIHPSYLARLLAVDDPARRVEVAEKLASGAVRGEEARELIVRMSGDNPRGGRPRMPGPAKVVGGIERDLERAEEGGELGAGELRRVPAEERPALARRYRVVAERLRELASRLEAE